jgi:hypothetical protein
MHAYNTSIHRIHYQFRLAIQLQGTLTRRRSLDHCWRAMRIWNRLSFTGRHHTCHQRLLGMGSAAHVSRTFFSRLLGPVSYNWPTDRSQLLMSSCHYRENDRMRWAYMSTLSHHPSTHASKINEHWSSRLALRFREVNRGPINTFGKSWSIAHGKLGGI